MSGDPDLEAVPDPEELVGKDELDEDDEMDLNGADLVDEPVEPPARDREQSAD